MLGWWLWGWSAWAQVAETDSVDAIVSKLGLDAAQQAEVQTVLADARAEAVVLREDLRETLFDLAQQRTEHPRGCKTSRLTRRATRTEGELLALKEDVRDRLLRLLTPAQLARLRTLVEERQRAR